MRILTFDSALTALVLVASSLAQTRPTPSQIFKSPDGTFQFRFPKSLVLCQPQLNGWTPESCSSYLAICPRSITATPSGPLHPETVACVAYPNSAYKGTNFGGAAFSVGEVADAKTKTDCLQFDELTTDPKKAHWQTVGGVKFRANSGGEGGLGHGLSAAPDISQRQMLRRRDQDDANKHCQLRSRCDQGVQGLRKSQQGDEAHSQLTSVPEVKVLMLANRVVVETSP